MEPTERLCPGGAVIARWVIASLTALSAASPAHGGEVPKNGVLSLIVENDLFYDNDRNYTSGVALVWVPTGRPAPDWALRIAHWLPWFPEEGAVRHGYSFGLNMYAPSDITLADPPLDDRPYAGWLYGTIGLGVETGQRLDQLALTLGVVGPASRAEQVQKFVHEIVGSPEPQGWDTQIGNEPGILLTYQRSWRARATTSLAGLDVDLTPHFGGALGNVYTYANAGLTLRAGPHLPLDYGPPRIQPSVPGSGYFAPARDFTWYLFGGFEGRAVAHNIFLDGNTFRDSRSVDKEPFVGDLQWGIVLTWRDVRLGYTHVVRTREFKTQREHDVFGSVSLSISF
ncbi:MAG TPA: lipid A deacylase LpxR family protein [Burkholderiales bacterium]|nr:lipid A deacylase LpxR family protein [Burkholderiales bacterium]